MSLKGLVDRERELAALRALVDAATVGRGGLVLVEGPAGIGKTRLLAAAREVAEKRGLEVLTACGSELERDFPFGAVRQLLEPPLAALAESALAESLELPSTLASTLHGAWLHETRGNLRLQAGDRTGAVEALRHARVAEAQRVEELRATGARPRREALTGRAALTASELRTAEMAAAGMSNPAIAQALFVTVKTVEGHLSGAYRKLNVRSRAELPKALEG